MTAAACHGAQLFALNLRHELASAMNNTLAEDACSSVTADYGPGRRFIVHNEDNPKESMGLQFYVRAKQVQPTGVHWPAVRTNTNVYSLQAVGNSSL